MHIFMQLLPLIQLPGGPGNHLGPVWLFTVMMSYNTRPIRLSVCSKDSRPARFQNKRRCIWNSGPAFCRQPVPSRPHCFHVCYVNRGKWDQERRGGRGETSMQIWEKCHIALSAPQTQLTALPVSAEEKAS